MSKEKIEGGPAYPSTNHVVIGDISTGGHPGMTLRDYFAGQALAGMLANGDTREVLTGDLKGRYESGKALVSAMSYLIADAMIAERNKQC